MAKHDKLDIAREWAAKILGSRTTAPWLPDYFDTDIEDRAAVQLRAVQELLPDALRTWAHRNGRPWQSVTAQDACELAVEIQKAVYQAADAQRRIDGRTIELAQSEPWSVPTPRRHAA